jgi:D-serine deaminase-like pyridoxal phosphate-dependent protein
VDYAKAVREWAPHLHFKGIQCYHGRNQHIRKYSDRKGAVASVVQRTTQALSLLREARIECSTITGIQLPRVFQLFF